MALTNSENAVAFKRVENLAASIQGVKEECDRLKAFAAQFGGDLSATNEHAVADLVAFRDDVINPFLTLYADADFTTAMQEFLTLPQV